MPSFDAQGAIAAGYSPQEVLDHLQSTGLMDVKGALKSGYSPEEILAHFASPKSGYADAAKSGFESGTGAAESGAAGIANKLGYTETAQALQARADANRASAAADYQPAPGQDSFMDALRNGRVGDALSAAGHSAVSGAAAGAPVLAGALAGTVAGPEVATVGALGGLTYGGLQAFGGVRDQRAAEGLNPDKLSGADVGNIALQTALNGTPAGKYAGGLVLQMAKRAGEFGARSGAGEIANLMTQGADTGQMPGSAGEMVNKVGDATVSGALSAPIIEGPMHAAQVGAVNVSQYMRDRTVSPNMKSFAAETAPWNEAFQKATQQVQASDPGLSPEDAQSKAYVLAQQSGVAPPTFSNLSPAAQNGIAELSAIQMYDGARKAATVGMGRPDDNPPPNAIFKNVLDATTINLGTLANLLKQNGLIDKDQHADLTGAISEAARHNRVAMENGADFGFFDTLRDKVGDLPIDPAIRDQILQQLRVADIASQAGLAKNGKGPLERNANIILPALGATAGALTGGLALAGGLGGVGRMFSDAAGHYGLRKLDEVMGTQLPDILKNRDNIQDYAQRNGLKSVADPVALQSMIAEMQGLKNNPPAPPQAPTGLTANPADRLAPVTSPLMNVVKQAQSGQPGSAPYPIYTRQPAPQGATPAPATLADAMKNTQAVLQARNTRLAQAARDALPTSRRGWSASIADQLGVQHGPMMDAIQKALENHPELSAMLKQPTIPTDLMRAITDHVGDLRDAGIIPTDPRFAGANATQVGSEVRNPLSYAHNLRQEAETAAAISSQHPELSDAVNMIRNPDLNGKTQAGRQAALRSYLNSIQDPQKRAIVESILLPLAGYGRKGSSGGG